MEYSRSEYKKIKANTYTFENTYANSSTSQSLNIKHHFSSTLFISFHSKNLQICKKNYLIQRSLQTCTNILLTFTENDLDRVFVFVFHKYSRI